MVVVVVVRGFEKILVDLPRLLVESNPFSRKEDEGEGKKLGRVGTFRLPSPSARCFSPLENGDQASLVKQSKLASIPPLWLRSKDSSFPSAKTTGHVSSTPIFPFFAKYRTSRRRGETKESGVKRALIRKDIKEGSGDE